MLGKKENGCSTLNHQDIIEEFELLTKDAGKVQEEILKRILEENKETEYLWQKCGLNGRTDLESFKACVPLVVHKDLEPYIQRIADDGSSHILTAKPVTALSLSSGTTQGKQKFVPFTDDMFHCALFIFKASFAYRNREFPIGNGKVLQFLYSSKQLKSTKSGLPAAPISAHVVNNPQYSQMLQGMKAPSCSPSEVIYSSDFHQSLYCHLLCGLVFHDQIHFITSVFAHGIVLAFRTLEQVWEELCTDIREGILSSRVTIPSVRDAMSSKVLVTPDPELAGTIYEKCKALMENGWYGLIPELFPNAKYISSIFTGTMQPYVKKLRHYGGEMLPLMSSDYGASEGWVGFNVNPKDPPEVASFAVAPNVGYFEFIPLKDGLELEPVGLTQVKVGEEYEIVLTNGTGMYRYRLGDIVKVKGFHNCTPLLQFIGRKSLILSIDIDKNTEEDLILSVETAAKILCSNPSSKIELLDFTSHVNTSSYPGHYIIIWELSGEAVDHQVLQECCNCLDLSFADAGYIVSRRVKTIGPLELRVVRKGTFNKVLNHFVGLGATPNQFKAPKYIPETNEAVIGILRDNVAMTFFSTAYP
ncbi:unnamed protein product [Cuscuta epithymum]|uniref:Uncharacterized protein n=1 Tax=Cuscuta epithymum TaxID=186058 RepID=A0AAV0GAN1_9ASTE|nr:unnamed protein product [Cuscuta epithymum]